MLQESKSPFEDYYGQRDRLGMKKGLFDPKGRAQFEQQLAARAKISSDMIMVYCTPSAPGYRRVEPWVASSHGDSPRHQETS